LFQTANEPLELQTLFSFERLHFSPGQQHTLLSAVGSFFGNRQKVAVLRQRTNELQMNMDLGGGVEFSARRRLLFRYDFGDTIIFHPALSGPFPLPGSRINNFQFETAVGFRF
jgi:hypothetical protein